MSAPAGNHVLEDYRRELRIFMKRCARIHRELSERAKRSLGRITYQGLGSWPEKDLRWRSRKLSQIRELEKKLQFPEAERDQRIQEIKDEILQDITARRGE
jgi:hypothetical protein